jgi:hypothetical protein
MQSLSEERGRRTRQSRHYRDYLVLAGSGRKFSAVMSLDAQIVVAAFPMTLRLQMRSRKLFRVRSAKVFSVMVLIQLLGYKYVNRK